MQGASAAPLDAALAPRSFGVEDRERFTPLPSASGDGLKKAVADLSLPAPAERPGPARCRSAAPRPGRGRSRAGSTARSTARPCEQPSVFAHAKTDQEPQAHPTTGDTSQCGVCFSSHAGLRAGLFDQGSLRSPLPPFDARPFRAALRCGLRVAPCSRRLSSPQGTRKPSSHWNGSPQQIAVCGCPAKGMALSRRFIRT